MADASAIGIFHPWVKAYCNLPLLVNRDLRFDTTSRYVMQVIRKFKVQSTKAKLFLSIQQILGKSNYWSAAQLKIRFVDRSSILTPTADKKLQYQKVSKAFQ